MRGSARRGLSRWGPGAVALAVLTGSAACGAYEGSAGPTTQSQVAPTTVRTTTPRGEPVGKYAGFTAPLYNRGDNWMCGPEAATSDRCLVSNQDTTVVDAAGRTQVRESEPRVNPPFDCFYVLPMASLDPDPSLLLTRDTSIEDTIVFQEAARLREQCRVYAPLYRRGGPANAPLARADVTDAFKHYMSRWNHGRHVVLFGHGDGADHLRELLQDEFDGDAQMRSLLISAFLIGGHTDSAAGSRTVGGLANVPTCAAPTDRGCVVGYAASAPETPRNVAALWGEAPAGRTRVCTNPAALGGGPGRLTAIVEYHDGYLRTPAPITTPFIELPDVVTAECVTSGAVTTLTVRPASTDPADARDVAALTRAAPPGDLHALDIPLAIGSIMQLIGNQAAGLG